MDDSTSNTSARKKKELVVHGNLCWFCKREGDEESWNGLGRLFKTQDVKIEGLPILYHEPCAAYCSGLGEIGSSGIDEKDIEKWFKYGERASNVGLKCAVCGLRGATAGCCMKQCSKTFHYTCARIAAFQGKAHFSVASRNVSCDKHMKWLAKPLEDEFMGMWMEGLGGWHGGLHQQAHHTWLTRLHSRHAEFQSKWLTTSNYPLTLLSPKPNAKLPGPEGVEVDALDALASLCAERMDNSDVLSADAPIKASVPLSPSGSTEQNVTSAALPCKAPVAATILAAGGDAGVVQPSIGSAQADVNLDSTQLPMPNTQAVSSSSQDLASAKPTIILPTEHQDGPTDIHLPTQHQDGHEAGADESTEQELTGKDNQFGSTAQASSTPAVMIIKSGEGLAPSPPEQPTDAITSAEGRGDSRPTAKRSQPVPEGDANMGMAPLDGSTFPTPLDSLRLLARTAVPSPAADEPSSNAPVAEQIGDGLLSSRLNRQRPAQSRHAQGEGSTSASADVIDSNIKSRKRPSSAGGSSMLATSGGGGSTLSMEESENEEGDSELGIYEPTKKKPKKFRFLKEVYTDPVSKFIPSPPSRHPRPTPTPRLVKKRRTPTNSAQTSPTAMPMPNSGRITPSDRFPNRTRPPSRGNSTPSASFDKHLPSLSHPSSQPGSPAHGLDIPSLANDRSRSGELPDTQVKDPDQLHHTHMDQRADDGLLSFDNPTSCGMPSSSALQFTGSDKIDGSVEIGMHDTGPMPSSSQPLHIDISQISGRNLMSGPPTSTLRDRCKPLHIDTSVPAIRGSVEPAPVSVTSVSPTSSGMKRTRVARKNTTGITSSTGNYSNMQPMPNHPAASEEDLIDVADAHLLGSAPHTRMPQSRPFPHQMFPHSSPSIIQGNQSSMPAPASVVTGRRPSTSTGSLARTGSGLGPQGMAYQDESQLAESDQYGDDGDLKFDDGPGMGVVVSAGQPTLLQQQQHPLQRTGSAGLKDLGNSDQSVSKVNMLLNNIQQVWVPEGMSGPEIAAMAAQHQQQGSIQFQPMLAQPTTIFTSSNMGMNGGQAVFAPVGVNPHTLSLLPRLPYLPHKMMSFANGLTPTGRPSRSTRCAVCIIQKKGKCGTEQAPKNCLRRNQNLLGLGNGFGPAAGMHPIQFQMQHPAAAMLQVQGGQTIVASPMVSPLVSPLPSPLPSPNNQYGSILLQQQPMGGVSNAMLMQTPHGLQIAGGFNINSRQGVSDRLFSQHMRNAGVRVGSMQGNVSSGLSGAMMSDQIMDLSVNGAPLRAINPGNMQGGNPRRDHLGGSNPHKSMGSQNMMRGMQDDGFNLGGGIPITLSQSGHFMDHGLDNPMDDFHHMQHMGAEWVQDPTGLNLIGSRVSASPHHHLMHPHDMLHDEMDHDIPGPESPFPRAQDRIQVFSGCVDLLPPLAAGEERVLGITMHPRYAARFHAHMRSEAGRNAPLVAVPHSTAAFLASRNVNPELVVDSLRGLIQESLLDPDVQPRFGLPDDLPVRGVDRFIVPPADPRHGVHGQWGLRTNEDVAAGTAIGAYGSYAMFREDHERFATNPPPSYRSVAQATSRSVLDAMWELLVESNAVSSTLPASLGAGALSHASRGLGEEEVVMCALGYGNLTAMSNDPTIDPFDGIEGVKENAHVLMFLIHGWPLPIMVTLQDLPALTEVLYSYGQAYWDLIAKCQQQLEELRG